MRPLTELIDREEPAWPLVRQWVSEAGVAVEVLPADAAAGEAALYAAQVTTRSPMGAIARHAAGIFIDHGWLRVLGAGGHPRFQRSLPGWNEGRSERFYLVADDALGGFFALNGGAWGEDRGQIYYFAPDSLRWEPCEIGFSQFLVWALSGKLAEFYASMRWDGWEAEVEPLSGDQAMHVYPPLWAKGPPVKERSRRPVPVAELWGARFDGQHSAP